MSSEAYFDFESELFAERDFASREIGLTDSQAEALLESGHYRRSTGFPYTATQYRRSNADGSCMHLVWRDGEPRLHRDIYDPHASPMSLYMHLTSEASTECAATCALAWSVVSLLAR